MPRARTFALLVLCLASCSSPYPDRGGEGGTAGDEPALRADELFVPSADSPGLFTFETSDPDFISERGFTIWALRAPRQDPFVARTVVLNKRSGDPAAGYGLVFCRHRSEGLSDEAMLVAMIDTEQEFLIGEALGSDFKTILPWTYSPRLKLGYNQANTLGLSLDGRSFALSLNGVVVARFEAIESDYSCGGENGYIAVISPKDRFPDQSVRIDFQER